MQLTDNEAADESTFRRPRKYVSFAAKVRFVARESTFCSLRKYVSSPAKVRFIRGETYSRFERAQTVKFFRNNIPLLSSILKTFVSLIALHCIATPHFARRRTPHFARRRTLHFARRRTPHSACQRNSVFKFTILIFNLSSFI